MDYNKPIPTLEFPSIHDFKIDGLDEPLVNLSDYGFLCESQYFKRGIAGSTKECWARQTVAQKLLEAESKLPTGYRFKIFDAYRPIVVQSILWSFYRNQVAAQNKTLTDEEIDKLTTFFVSKPSYDIERPSLHNTGGAIDLTIVDNDNQELNMGSQFDEFSDRAWSNHFEVYEKNEEIRNNRRLLYNVMLSSDFTNLPSEWWHYDYGTKFWGYFKNTNALYRGLINFDGVETLKVNGLLDKKLNS